MERYGARITRHGETVIIKEFPEPDEDNFAQLERLRRIFYPELDDSSRMDKSVIKKYRRG